MSLIDTAKEMLENVKTKFKKDDNVSSSNENKDTDGMMSIDDYFDNGKYLSENSDNKKESNNQYDLKDRLKNATKSFVNDVNYNPFSDQEEVLKVDKKEFKDNWFKITVKALVTCIMIFLAVLCFTMIYRLCYSLLNNTETPSFGSYTDYLVPEDNLAPLINENDLIIVKSQEFYDEGDIILYEFAGTSHKIGKVVDSGRGYYIINDNNIKSDSYQSKIDETLVVGKEVKIIKNFSKFYNFVTSPIAIILLVVIIGSYFLLMSLGKVKDKGTI